MPTVEYLGIGRVPRYPDSFVRYGPVPVKYTYTMEYYTEWLSALVDSRVDTPCIYPHDIQDTPCFWPNCKTLCWVYDIKSTFFNDADQPYVSNIIIPPMRLLHWCYEIALPCWDDDCKEKTVAIVYRGSYYHTEFLRLGFFHARFTNKNGIDDERGLLDWWDDEFERWRKIEEIPA